MCRNYWKKLRASGILAAGLQHNKVRRHQQNPLQSIQMNCKGIMIERDMAVDGWIGSLQSCDGFVVKLGRLCEKQYGPEYSEWVVKFWIEDCVTGQCKNNFTWNTRGRFWNAVAIERQSYIFKKVVVDEPQRTGVHAQLKLSFEYYTAWFRRQKNYFFFIVPTHALHYTFKTLKSHTKTLKIRPYMFRFPLKPSSGGPWPNFACLLTYFLHGAESFLRS